MSNRAYLVGTSIHCSSINQLDMSAYEVLAEGSNMIPVPWFFCFNGTDLQPADLQYQNDDLNEISTIPMCVPCAPTSEVLSNLLERKALFVDFIGDPYLGEEYWRKAVNDIQSVQHEYISIHPLEVFLLNDVEESSLIFNKCFEAAPSSFESIEQLSNFDSDSKCYSVLDFYSNSNLKNIKQKRNSSAMDMGIAGIDTSTWKSIKKDTTEKEELQWWKALTSALTEDAKSFKINPITQLEFVQLIMECYTNPLPLGERWDVLEFSYIRNEPEKKQSSSILLEAKYSSEQKSWKKPAPCHVKAPIWITNSYLKNAKLFEQDLKAIHIHVKWAGDWKVEIEHASLS
ncbi:MAG: hypothetical protein CMK64_11940 [Pseudoalteromonas sp.]|nr:hypothetical protein [Pseudoalteromonas sp.]